MFAGILLPASSTATVLSVRENSIICAWDQRTGNQSVGKRYSSTGSVFLVHCHAVSPPAKLRTLNNVKWFIRIDSVEAGLSLIQKFNPTIETESAAYTICNYASKSIFANLSQHMIAPASYLPTTVVGRPAFEIRTRQRDTLTDFVFIPTEGKSLLVSIAYVRELEREARDIWHTFLINNIQIGKIVGQDFLILKDITVRFWHQLPLLNKNVY